MKISGFTYVRNGFKFDYPIVQSLNSLLPIVDELIVVIGDSDDGTHEAIINLNNPKIKIIDTVWDEDMRNNGTIFSQQSDIGLKNCSGNWAFHLQIDEVIHENSILKITETINRAESDKNIDGLLFPFLHFWGDYNHIRNTRRTHRYEIRAFKNTGKVFSYNDSQGFRKYNNKGLEEKLNVIKINTPVFHYSYTRHPKLMKQKANYFHRFWHDNKWLEKNTDKSDFDFNEVDQLEVFLKDHPVYMTDVIKNKNWDFTYDPSKSNMKLKDKLLTKIEKVTGIRLFEYRNYKLLKK
jgi:hypothetical protein